jgi:hypothetical protein
VLKIEKQKKLYNLSAEKPNTLKKDNLDSTEQKTEKNQYRRNQLILGGIASPFLLGAFIWATTLKPVEVVEVKFDSNYSTVLNYSHVGRTWNCVCVSNDGCFEAGVEYAVKTIWTVQKNKIKDEFIYTNESGWNCKRIRLNN